MVFQKQLKTMTSQLKKTNSVQSSRSVDKTQKKKFEMYKQPLQYSIQNNIFNPKTFSNHQNSSLQEIQDDKHPLSYSAVKQTNNNTISIINDTQQTKQVSSFQTESELNSSNNNLTFQQIEKNLIEIKVGISSKAGKNIDKRQKQNQDSYINLDQYEQSHVKIFAVCDGHGFFGQQVSSFVKKNLPELIMSQLSNFNNQSVIATLKNAFLTTHSMLCKSKIDINMSGSTTVCCLFIGKHIFTANLGDSRAMVCSKSLQGLWSLRLLSVDHKPNLPEEKERILKMGGQVQRIRDPRYGYVGPYRVWQKNGNLPGLAMSRSFGDLKASKVGVIQDPQVIHYQLNENDKFIIICSDGLHEFMSNQQIMQKVIPFYEKNEPEKACQELYQDSLAMWKQFDSVVDDITSICIFFGKD